MLQTQTVKPELLELLKSMTFFEDADLQPMPKMFVDVKWEQVKNEIIKTVSDYQKSL